jgi:hypothetical protein
MFYRGTKDQIQTPDNGNPPFTYRANIDRVGVFGNYLFFDKLDLLGGYIRSQDDWMPPDGGPMSHYISNSVRCEADYYFKTGTVVMARYDHALETIASNPTMHTQAWGIGGEHALVPLGNIVLRAAYNQEHDGDPVALTGTTDKLFKLDIRYMW